MGEKRLFFRSNCAIRSRLAPLSAQQTLVSLAIHPEPLTWYLDSARDLDQAMFMPYRYPASRQRRMSRVGIWDWGKGVDTYSRLSHVIVGDAHILL